MVKPSRSIPTERQESIALAGYLDRCGATHCHIPNEGHRSAREGAVLKQMGVRAGMPDHLVLSRPGCHWCALGESVVRGRWHDTAEGLRPCAPPEFSWRGVAVELKRRGGGRVSPAQQRVAEELRAAGWLVLICEGAKAAVEELQKVGFFPLQQIATAATKKTPGHRERLDEVPAT